MTLERGVPPIVSMAEPAAEREVRTAGEAACEQRLGEDRSSRPVRRSEQCRPERREDDQAEEAAMAYEPCPPGFMDDLGARMLPAFAG